MTHYYAAFPAVGAAPLDLPWDSSLWQQANEARIDQFHAASNSHRPDARARLLYDADNLYLRFRVKDRYVVARHTHFQDPVWRDSCVEFFIQPRPSSGYFTFEINCVGALLSYYIEDATRTPDGFAKFTRLVPEHGARIRIAHSMPSTVTQEQTGPVVWHIGCEIPLAVLEAYAGPLGPLAGQAWRGNFYKCADDSSHPHWASWAPIGEALNFHQPHCFAPLRFAIPPGCG
ncbi:MAG: carbohydrate-binding family 9-like protein [Thermoguttaceae bacterium]